jgi:hypothetical protein
MFGRKKRKEWGEGRRFVTACSHGTEPHLVLKNLYKVTRYTVILSKGVMLRTHFRAKVCDLMFPSGKV